MKITVNNNQRTLLRDNQHFFYLADTCWSAFTSIREEEWQLYLEKRRSQGFNTLQINILPQWDRSRGTLDILPFEEKNGNYDFSQLNIAYFERGKRLCQLAEEYGFTLSLVVLWSNYVAGTWASELDKQRNVIPQEYLSPYFETVLTYFDEFSPIYFIGGDTDFPEEATTTYLEAFDYFEKHSLETLKTIHIKGRLAEIPAVILQHLDLILYQSGHNSSFLNMPYFLAEHFYQQVPALPIINAEPCYEQMGFSRRVYGRFSQRDVRKAAWQSILSGACAGITYGAHGIWSWHYNQTIFSESIGEAFDTPMSWMEALHFPGADDYGFIKQLFELASVVQLIPCNELLIHKEEQIRMAMSDTQKQYFIYLPSNTAIQIQGDFTDFQLILVDLKENRLLKPEYTATHQELRINTHTSQEDVLIIAHK